MRLKSSQLPRRIHHRGTRFLEIPIKLDHNKSRVVSLLLVATRLETGTLHKEKTNPVRGAEGVTPSSLWFRKRMGMLLYDLTA
jgi:hypothetical protein